MVSEDCSQMLSATVSSGSSRGSEKRKRSLQWKGKSMSSIWTNRINHLHVRDEVQSRLMNAVTHCQTVGPTGGDAGEKAKNTVCNRRTAQCHQFEQIYPVDYIPVMRSEEGWWMPLSVLEQLLCNGIRMLNLGHVQKRFLGQIKFVKLFVKAPTTIMILTLTT